MRHVRVLVRLTVAYCLLIGLSADRARAVTPQPGWPHTTGGVVRSSPALGDLDGDGDLEVVVGSWDSKVYAWSCDVPTTDPLPWPMFHHDPWNTGAHGHTGRFWDVPVGCWAWREIQACVEAAIVGGYPEGDYKPYLLVCRDTMAVFISRAMAGGDANVPDGPTEATFDDVPTGYWSYDYIEYCVANDVVQGYDPVTYGPTNVVSRDAMAVFVARAHAGGDAGVPAGPTEATFDDVPTDYWSYKYIEYCVDNSIVQGYDPVTYGPTAVVSRGQMAVFITRAFELTM